jgi:hypothetical protein
VSVEFLNSTFKLAFTPEDGNFHIDILELTGETFPFGPFEGSGEGWLAGDLTHGFGSVTFHYACGDLHVSYESFWNTVDYDPLEFVYDCTWEVTGGTGAFRFAHGGGPDLGDLVINHNNNDLTEGTFAATGIISWAPPR